MLGTQKHKFKVVRFLDSPNILLSWFEYWAERATR